MSWEGAPSGTRCSAVYPLTGGIPRLLPDAAVRSRVRENTAERFGYEWNEFSSFDFHEELVSLTTWFRPRRLEDLAGLVVLEAGCGMGRHATIATHYGVQVLVGLDLGNAVDAAFGNTRHLPGGLHRPGRHLRSALKPKVFDAAYSLGVLHHVPDPGRGFRAIAAKVKDSGWFQVWVYGGEGNGWLVYIVNPIRSVTSRMPLDLLRFLSLPVALPLVLFARTLYRIPWAGRGLPMRLTSDGWCPSACERSTRLYLIMRSRRSPIT